MLYRKRISDSELIRKLNSSGAVLIRGVKSCGKTESAKQLAGSILNIDKDKYVSVLLETAPQRLLLGETPRLIDNWQEQPKIWNYIRHEIDNRKQTAQFILTGSENPEENFGTGRFTTLNMQTMSWQEMGFSTGKISMKNLLEGTKIDIYDEPTDLEFIIEKIVIGGFPAMLEKNVNQAIDLNRAYIDLLSKANTSHVSDVKRPPVKVRNLLRSLARNTATMIDITNLAADIREKENVALSRPSIYKYLDALNRLMITEDQPAWNTHIRSSASLRKAPKRHFTDVSLAVAALEADEKSLLDKLNFTEYLFESLATHELRVYAQANDAKVYHYSDSSGLKADAIVQKYNGDWCAFEIKLGTGQIDEAAVNLKKFVSVLNGQKVNPPKSLNIITGTGVSYTRTDGINVISLASLGV